MSRGAGSFAQVRALAFDLDGTLIDSKLDLALAVNATLAASGSHLFGLGEGQQLHQFADLDVLQRTHGSFDFSA
jgi:phosphoglycolate phosphatase-like HAD superfamily hydrolase